MLLSLEQHSADHDVGELQPVDVGAENSAHVDRLEHELAATARPILDQRHTKTIEAFKALYSERESEGRATTDVAIAARAATFGAVDSLVVNIDEVITGRIDEQTGEVTFADQEGAETYGIVDEIAGRTLAMGGKVIGERKADIPGGGALAAILRYAV